MDDDAILRIIRIVADKAWNIAFDAEVGGGVCLAIENLSDDPATRSALLAEIKQEIAP